LKAINVRFVPTADVNENNLWQSTGWGQFINDSELSVKPVAIQLTFDTAVSNLRYKASLYEPMQPKRGYRFG